jgi:pimeloyl-ACP methyl ester carboxylesterase
VTAARERIVRFGAQGSLSGIISTPRDGCDGAVHVVLVNAGVVHRVGPNRLYVDIARALASHGFPVLRFDLSGLGDSHAVTSIGSLSESVVADVRTAFDFLAESRRATSFVICGLCSGANYSMLTAFADARVVGTILIDPTVSRTWRSTIIHHARRLRHPATWGKVVRLQHPIFRKSLRRLRSLTAAQIAQGQSEQHVDRVAPPDAAIVRTLLQQAVDRGLHILVVFTGGVNQQYNYRNQLFDLLPGLDFRGHLHLEFMPFTDHSVSDGSSRVALLGVLAAWMATRFPMSTQSQESA